MKTLQSLNRDYFTVADLEKITNLSRNSLRVVLNRFVKREVLTHLRRGVYQLSSSTVDVRKIANQLYYPSYLSFEAALSTYGILSQVPYTQTFATSKKSKKMMVGNTEVEYSQIQKSLFFGYVQTNGIYIAEPEKALLDQVYLVSRGRRMLAIDELDLRGINKKQLNEYAVRFPDYVAPLISQINQKIGLISA